MPASVTGQLVVGGIVWNAKTVVKYVTKASDMVNMQTKMQGQCSDNGPYDSLKFNIADT